jgi:hypothetical protein
VESRCFFEGAFRLYRDEAQAAAQRPPPEQIVRHVHERDTGEEWVRDVSRRVEEANERDRRERERRDEIVRRLHKEYVATHRTASIQIQEGRVPLPRGWVETRLAEMGEDWLRDDYWLPA